MTELIHESDDYSTSLNSFLDGPRNREWLKYDNGLDVYVRKAQHMDELHNLRPCLDVANISMPKSLRGKGCFTEWLEECERQADTRNLHVYVENLLNARLAQFLYRRGYHMVSNDCNIPCLMRRPENLY